MTDGAANPGATNDRHLGDVRYFAANGGIVVELESSWLGTWKLVTSDFPSMVPLNTEHFGWDEVKATEAFERGRAVEIAKLALGLSRPCQRFYMQNSDQMLCRLCGMVWDCGDEAPCRR
jgi:hypothetical protein